MQHQCVQADGAGQCIRGHLQPPRQHCGVRRITLQGIGDALVPALWQRGDFARYGGSPSALGKK